MFTLAQLTQFVAVAEELHFGRAAARLGITQPPLSRQIQLLEKDLGVPLFIRSSRSVELTPAGQVFLTEARRLLDDSERVALAVRGVAQGKTGLLRVGFTASSIHSGLATVLTTARAAISDVELELRELVTAGQLEALAEGTIDIGLLRPTIIGPGLSSRTLLREPLVVALPSTHELAAVNRPLQITDLQNAPMVMYGPVESRYFHELVSAVFQTSAISPLVVQYLTQIHSILALVNLNWGAALVPESTSKVGLEHVVYRSLALPIGTMGDQVELNLVWRRDNTNPALRRLVNALQRERLISKATAAGEEPPNPA
jgi:DNA-binding transcriptional LysR family regulator